MDMYDVVIIGAGIAGSYLVQQIKDEYNVLIIDKSKEIKLDSGIVSLEYDEFLPKKFVKKKIKKMSLFSPDGTEIALRQTRSYAYLLKREQLGNYLRKQLDIRIEKPWKIDFFDDHVHVWTDNNDYKSKIVIGADGALSFTRKQLGIKSPKIFTGVMANSPIRRSKDISIFLNKNYSKNFYSWYIPNNDEYGLIDKNIENGFKMFQHDMDFKYTHFNSYPMAIGYTKSYNYRSLLVGEACGQSKPLTGGGIIYTLKSCQYAIKAVENALEKEEFYIPFKNYDYKWKKELKKEIIKQKIFRKIYRRLNNNNINNLFSLFKEDVENLDDFEYDKLINEWKNVRKWKLMKAILMLPKLIV